MLSISLCSGLDAAAEPGVVRPSGSGIGICERAKGAASAEGSREDPVVPTLASAGQSALLGPFAGDKEARLRDLRAAIVAGEYRPDPRVIAAAIIRRQRKRFAND